VIILYLGNIFQAPLLVTSSKSYDAIQTADGSSISDRQNGVVLATRDYILTIFANIRHVLGLIPPYTTDRTGGSGNSLDLYYGGS